jgi:glycosyltransferase involved in cell wall biosynthesis
MQSTLYAQVEQILDVLPELTGSFELIIIDDGSTDATIEIADELTRRYPQVVVVRHGTPRGSAAAVQTGFQRSRGEVICVKDDRGGLPLEQVPTMWRAMHKAAVGQETTGRPLNGPLSARWRPALSGGFRMIHRQAIGPLGEIAAQIGDGEPSATCPSRPGRPNFLRAARVS